MTEKEYIDKIAKTAVPHDLIPMGSGQRLRILDLSQIPGTDRKYFDEQGIWKVENAPEVDKTEMKATEVSPSPLQLSVPSPPVLETSDDVGPDLQELDKAPKGKK